ncbi:hypothetical protein DQ04_04191040 [Trypanosoma grayi]|uniref:hypothetical protein n=1 Tax=Trypanosoma grayi TaxID=71804 RepID=UPI0004F4B148|nr:hypothetical protein DQ04_04191040 [Trypanosoma grayi]KEG10093.1 hypothetical protein DQ04_04191040 [Trypanosoma grayi]
MRRDEWLAALQEMPWTPCEESHGLPRYRAVEAYHCTYCAYTVCARCYNAIPTGLLLASRESGATGNPAVPRGSTTLRAAENDDDDGTPQGVATGEGFSWPRCFLCRSGALVRETVPVHEWTCEGPRPARRLQRGHNASYDMDVTQRYYTMKEQRDKRALSKAPLVARFHGADPPSRTFADHHHQSSSESGGGDDAACDSAGSDAVHRGPFCEEGSSFVFSVQNPRMEQSCVWCAVNRRVQQAQPVLGAEETVSPLQKMRCPPSLPGIPPRRFRVAVPYGAYGLHNVHALALYLTDDIFRKATLKLQGTTADVEPSTAGEQPQKQLVREGQLTAGKEFPRSVVRPLLVVEVLHRVATSDPLRELLSARWFARSTTIDAVNVSPPPAAQPSEEVVGVLCDANFDERNKNKKNNDSDGCTLQPRKETMTAAQAPGEEDDVCMTWSDGLRCEELLLTVDYLLHGRSVAVYGIASKYFFLQHVSQSAELRHYGAAVVDGYRAAPNHIARQLRDIAKQLRERREKAERELLRSFFFHQSHRDSLGVDRRSEAPPRENEQQEEERELYIVDASPTDSPRSQSYRTPLRSRAKEEGRSLSRRRCADNATADGFAVLMNLQLATPPPREEKGGVPLFSPAPCAVKQREHSMLLVRGGETDAEVQRRTVLGQEQQRLLPPSQDKREKAEMEPPLSHHHEEVDEKARAWSRRHWLREHSDWNYDVPLRGLHGAKRHRDEGDDDTAAVSTMHDRRPRPPRFTVSSPDLLRSLRLACRAPMRACIGWMSLPSPTAQGLVSGSAHTASLSSFGQRRPMLLVVHGVDQLDPPLLLELQAIAREHPHHVVLLCSFDDPNWPVASGAGLLDPFRVAYVHLRSLLLPRVHEMAPVKSMSLLTELEASMAGGGKFSRYTSRGGALAAGATLPLHDTIRRVLFSLPATFSELLRCMIERQETSGENVFIPMSLHQQHFDECGMMVSMGRLKAIERELTSNRLAILNAAENKLMIPQHRRLLKVMEEVVEQRRNVDASAGPAPVEA